MIESESQKFNPDSERASSESFRDEVEDTYSKRREEMLRQCQDYLESKNLNIPNPREVAEDIVQEAFKLLLNHSGPYAGNSRYKDPILAHLFHTADVYIRDKYAPNPSRMNSRKMRETHLKSLQKKEIAVSSPENKLIRQMDADKLTKIITDAEYLDELEKLILINDLHGDDSLASIGEEVKLTRERIRQIEAEAFVKLRKKTGDQDLFKHVERHRKTKDN